MLRDLKLAARRLAATPLFTVFAILSLAVGVGVTTAVYSVVDSIFWKDPGVADPATALFVTSSDGGRLARGHLSRPDYDDLRAAQTSFSAIAAVQSIGVAAILPSKTEVAAAEAVDGHYFSVVGVRAALGRTIDAADEGRVAAVVVLSHALWRKRFMSDARVIGRTLHLSGRPFEIIGVAQPPFEGTSTRFGPSGTGLWVPMSTVPMLVQTRPGTTTIAERDRRRVFVIGRVRAGVDVASATAEISRISASLDVTHPQRAEFARPIAPRRWSAQTMPAIDAEAMETLNRFGVILVGLVALVLVVACINLSNLVLARGIIRNQEFTIRRALGAPRWRLVREQAAESLLIAVGGAVASYVVLQALRTWMTTDFAMGPWTLAIEPAVNSKALAVAASAVLLSLIVFGLEPALALTRSRDLKSDLAESSGSVGVPKARRQRALLRWQVAVSAGFFIIATMCVKYTIAELRHDSGVEMDRLAVAAINLQAQGWDEVRTRRALDRVVEEAQRLREGESLAISSGLPFGTAGGLQGGLSLPEEPILPGSRGQSARVVAATPSIFRTLGVPIVLGRGFDDRDHAGSAPVIVLNETAARGLFGTIQAVGRQVRLQLDQTPLAWTVIGVAKDTDGGRYMSTRKYPGVYVPFAQQSHRVLTISLRSTSDSAAAVASLQRVLSTADREIAIDYIGTGRTVLTGPYMFFRAAGTVAVGLGGLTLLLAMVGLFGIQSHTVAHRTREIGVRMTFGATGAQIKRMVLRDGYVPVVQGLAIGVFIGFTGRAIIRNTLDMNTEISIVDPWMFLVVPIPLMLAAFFACYWPAQRASRVDPQVALRHH